MPFQPLRSVSATVQPEITQENLFRHVMACIPGCVCRFYTSSWTELTPLLVQTHGAVHQGRGVFSTLSNIGSRVGNKAIVVRHLDRRQALCVDDRIFRDDLILK